MSKITINKHNKSITFINNGIGFSQIGVADEILDLINNLQIQFQQKENIIKEVREYIEKHKHLNWYNDSCYMNDLLEILDKVEE